jgi:hypothetical protein
MEKHSGRSFRSKQKHFSAKTTILEEKWRKFKFYFWSLKVEAKLLNHFHGRQDTQHNDTEQNATQHNSALNDTQHNNTGKKTVSVLGLISTLCINDIHYNVTLC